MMHNQEFVNNGKPEFATPRVAEMNDERQPLLGQQYDESLLVELSGPEDPLNPMNMAPWRKWACASILGAMTFAATFSSSVLNAAIPITAEEFNVGLETMALSTSLYVFGFATGPILMGPASELHGRKIPFFVGYVGFILSQIPVGLAKNAETVLVFRFLGGVSSSCSPAIVGGYLADFLPPVERGVAVAVFAATTLIGPSIGSIVGSMLVASSLGWRWTAWVSLILGVVFGAMGFIILPETYLPVVLKREAQRLRRQTGNSAFYSKLEEKHVDLKDFLVRYLTRPLYMILLEPILALMTMYITFTFGMVYLLFVAYPVSFIQQRGFGPVQGSLPLLSICVGILIGAFYVSYYTLTTIRRKMLKNSAIVPEDRLPPMIVGAFLLAIGLFWFALTSSPSISPVPQILAGVPIGVGVQVVLLQSLAYLIDIYTTQSNSAISGTVVIRSLLGGTFPLFAIGMYAKLGVFWSTTLLGFSATLLTPIPVLLYFYGDKIRSYSKFVPKA